MGCGLDTILFNIISAVKQNKPKLDLKVFECDLESVVRQKVGS